MNKKVLLTSAMAFTAAAAMANPFSDVPYSHWSYDAVNLLSSKGIVQGYSDGTFKGDKTVTRYQFATIVARMLANIDQNGANAASTGNSLNREDLQTLEKLTVEFADELALLGVKVTALEDDMQVVKTDVANLKKDVDSIKSDVEKGGFDKVSISGDMLVRHDDSLKHTDRYWANNNGGESTHASFRLNFDAKIDEKIEARVRTVIYADNYGNSLGGATRNGNARDLYANDWNEKSHKNQNDVDIAVLKIKDTLFGGDLRIGRDYISHGSALLMNDYVDGIGFAKKIGAVDFELNMIYGNENEENCGRNDKDIWNLNFGYEVKGHKLHLGYYTWDYVNSQDIYDEDGNYVETVPATNIDDKAQFIEFAAEGEIGKKGDLSYKFAYIHSDIEKFWGEEDLEGNLFHVELNYDTNKDFALKLAYTTGDKEFISMGGDTRMGYHHSFDDEVASPLEDVGYMGYGLGSWGMCNSDNMKVQVEYKPADSKHSFRLAYDMYKTEESVKLDLPEVEANILTLEYKYQLAENTKLRIGYATLDGDKNVKDFDDNRFYAEVYSKF